MTSTNNSAFSISGLGSGFADRQRDLFACLDAAEKQRESSGASLNLLPVEDEVDEGTVSRVEKRRGTPTKRLRGKESIFKRPEMPAPRRARHSVPDHQRNPHKYTKYSLGDVSPEDMSDRSNAAAAFSFLREMEARKDGCIDSEVDPLAPPKSVVFKPSRSRGEKCVSSLGAVSTISTDVSSEADRPSFRSSKLVMPEYIVGQKAASKKKNNFTSMQADQVAKKHKTKEITLLHLVDEDID